MELKLWFIMNFIIFFEISDCRESWLDPQDEYNFTKVEKILRDKPSIGYIISNGYPRRYEHQKCLIELDTPPLSSLVIRFRFIDLDLPGAYSKSKQCLRDYILIIIIDRDGRFHYTDRICGQKLPEPIQTMQSRTKVLFVSSGDSSSESELGSNHRGFKLRYEFVSESGIFAPPSIYNDPDEKYLSDCGGNSVGLSGYIKSPGFPNTYPSNVTCNWLIRVEPFRRIYIRLLQLGISSTVAECDRASLMIIDGYRHEPEQQDFPTWRHEDIHRFCGNHLYYNEEGMKSYLSHSNRVIVRFVTREHPSADQLLTHNMEGISVGFHLLWTQVNSLTASDSQKSVMLQNNELDLEHREINPIIVTTSECPGFLCRGGEFCIDNGKNICAERTRLCINASLQCDGVANCAENDKSDELYCQSSGIFFVAIMFGLVCVLTPIVVAFFHRRYSKVNKSRKDQDKMDNKFSNSKLHLNDGYLSVKPCLKSLQIPSISQNEQFKVLSKEDVNDNWGNEKGSTEEIFKTQKAESEGRLGTIKEDERTPTRVESAAVSRPFKKSTTKSTSRKGNNQCDVGCGSTDSTDVELKQQQMDHNHKFSDTNNCVENTDREIPQCSCSNQSTETSFSVLSSSVDFKHNTNISTKNCEDNEPIWRLFEQL